MIMLILVILFLTLISLWLVNQLLDIGKALKEEKATSEMIRRWADTYWQYYVEACDRNRELRKEIDRLSDDLERMTFKSHVKDDYLQWRFDRIQELESQLADALHDAEHFRGMSIDKGNVIEELNERIIQLEQLAQHEFEWSMEYSASVEKYAGLYDEALKEIDRLEDKVDELEQYIMEIEYGDDL